MTCSFLCKSIDKARLARLVSLETYNSTHSSLQNVSEFPATLVSFCVLKHLHISECQFCHRPSFNSQVGSLCSPITAEFLLWSSCQRFFQLFGCCPVLAQEHHCPVWVKLTRAGHPRKGIHNDMRSLRYELYCTSTLVTSRHVKHQSGKNIQYFLHLFTSLYPKNNLQKRSEEIRQYCVQKVHGATVRKVVKQ